MPVRGPNSPNTLVDDATVGTLTWSNPGNAQANDGLYAQIGTSLGGTTHYLKVSNFKFTVPSSATINGILVEIDRRQIKGGASTVVDSTIKIIKSDGTLGATNKSAGAAWATTDTYDSFGSSADLWGETWLYSDINNSNFGVVLSANILSDVGTASALVDHIRITVTYTGASRSDSVSRSNAVSRRTASGRGTASNRGLS